MGRHHNSPHRETLIHKIVRILIFVLVAISASGALITVVQSKSCNSEVNFILSCSLKSLKQLLDRIGLIFFNRRSSCFFKKLKGVSPILFRGGVVVL